MPHVLFAVTVAMTAQAFLRDHAVALASRGWDVSIACSPEDGTDSFQSLQSLPGVSLFPIPMKRTPSPWRDAKGLVAFRLLFKKLTPDIVIASTPKASLLALLAARMQHVPVRIFHVRGLRSEGLHGLRHLVTRWSEHSCIKNSTNILVDSASLLAYMRAQGLLKPDQGEVLGSGSCCGVDVDWFRPPSEAEKNSARESWGVDPNSIIVGYLGRITADKGITELTTAMVSARESHPNLQFVVIGAIEEQVALANTLREIERVPWARLYPATPDPRIAYWAFDVFASPSVREGFPIALLEAQACGLPCITTEATGCVDAVENGITGILVSPRTSKELRDAILRLAKGTELRQVMGQAGRDRVIREFRRDDVTERFLEYVRRAAIKQGYEGGKHAES